MGKRIDKVKMFVYEYADVIGYVVGCTATVCLGAAVYGVTKRKVKTRFESLPVMEWKPTPIPDSLKAFGVNDLIDYVNTVSIEASEYTVSVSDLGKLGEALCTVEDITPESKAYVLIEAIRKLNED